MIIPMANIYHTTEIKLVGMVENWFLRCCLGNLVITKKYIVLHISSSYAKILGETKFQPREFPRSGSKALDVERRERRRRREE